MYAVTRHLSEGSFVRNVVVQIPKFYAKSNLALTLALTLVLTLIQTLTLALTLCLLVSDK